MNRNMTQCAVISLLVLAVLPGCSVIQDLLGQGGGETGKSELKRFGSENELLDYFKSQITARNDSIAAFDRGAMDGDAAQPPSAESGGGAGGADSAAGDGSAVATPTPAPGDANLTSDGSHSGTTTQEQGVDEADVVKTDGNNLYVISTKNADSVLRIVGISGAGQTQLLSETTLTGYGRDLYLHGGKVAALTSGGGFAYPMLFDTVAVAQSDAVAGDAGAAGGVSGSGDTVSSVETDGSDVITADPIGGVAILPPFDQFVYERPYTLVTIVDVTNPAATTVLSTTKIDGSVSSSRMVDGVLHLVMANYQDYYYDVLPRLGAPMLDLSTVDTVTLLPKYTQTQADGSESSGNVVTWESLYRPTDPDGFGVVTLVSLDVDNDAQFSAVGIVAEPGMIYSSIEALYLTDTNYDWQGNTRTTTDIYKFKYEGRGATPTATGTVPGRILNQYSMSEHNGNLRVATTVDATFSFDGFGFGTATESQNNVYVLSQSDSSLAVVGRAENIATGETIQSARFIGDKGFLVTFLQVDPLFTMDLSDPANPRVVGELKVPGYSTFLTPIDENHLLAVGQYVPPPDTLGNWGVQLSIFDVTDFAHPTLTSNIVIGADVNTSAYSEALWDPKAFTYFAEGGVVALPISIYEYVFFEGGGTDGVVVDPGQTVMTPIDTGDGSSGSTGTDAGAPPPDSTAVDVPVDVVDVAPPTGFDGVFIYRVSAADGLVELGRISTRFDEAQYWGSSFTRGVFVGSDVYAVTDLGVHTASMNDLSAPESQLFFGLPYDIVEEPPILIDPVPVEPIDGGALTTDGTSSSDGGATGAGTSVEGVSTPTKSNP